MWSEWPEWDPCRARIRDNRDCCSELSSADVRKAVRIIPGLADIVQVAKLRKQSDIHQGGDESVLSDQEYIRKVVDDVGEDKDFKGGSWVSIVQFVNANGGGIVNGCLRDIENYLNLSKLLQ
ncbi:hypothetical protein Tco_0732318 [Tanacetum coccineum]